MSQYGMNRGAGNRGNRPQMVNQRVKEMSAQEKLIEQKKKAFEAKMAKEEAERAAKARDKEARSL